MTKDTMTNHSNTLYPTMKDAVDNELINQLEDTNEYINGSMPVEDIWDIKSIADKAIECKTMYDENGTKMVYYHLKPVYDNAWKLWLLVCKNRIN